MTEHRARQRLSTAGRTPSPRSASPLSDVLIRPAAPGEYEAIGELSEAAYSHDYDISDRYRESLRDVAARR
jgi:hypothetical protein